MDERQLIVEIVKAVASLAWPGMIAEAVWLFRKEIVRMLPRMRLNYKDAEIDLVPSVFASTIPYRHQG